MRMSQVVLFVSVLQNSPNFTLQIVLKSSKWIESYGQVSARIWVSSDKDRVEHSIFLANTGRHLCYVKYTIHMCMNSYVLSTSLCIHHDSMKKALLRNVLFCSKWSLL